MLLVLILLQFRILSSFMEFAFYPHLRNPLPQSAFRFRVLSQPNKTSGVYAHK
jgi:hypothetical protein